jgi:hypothetical protein
METGLRGRITSYLDMLKGFGGSAASMRCSAVAVLESVVTLAALKKCAVNLMPGRHRSHPQIITRAFRLILSSPVSIVELVKLPPIATLRSLTE